MSRLDGPRVLGVPIGSAPRRKSDRPERTAEERLDALERDINTVKALARWILGTLGGGLITLILWNQRAIAQVAVEADTRCTVTATDVAQKIDRRLEERLDYIARKSAQATLDEQARRGLNPDTITPHTR